MIAINLVSNDFLFARCEVFGSCSCNAGGQLVVTTTQERSIGLPILFRSSREQGEGAFSVRSRTDSESRTQRLIERFDTSFL